MSDLDSRVVRCFGAVFPWLTPEEIRSANAESSEIWDSLTAVTLVAVVQEEFGVEIPQELIPQLDSFGAFVAFLQKLDGEAIQQ